MLSHAQHLRQLLDEHACLLRLLNIEFKDCLGLALDSTNPLGRFGPDALSVALAENRPRDGPLRTHSFQTARPVPKTATVFYFEASVLEAAPQA